MYRRKVLLPVSLENGVTFICFSEKANFKVSYFLQAALQCTLGNDEWYCSVSSHSLSLLTFTRLICRLPISLPAASQQKL